MNSLNRFIQILVGSVFMLAGLGMSIFFTYSILTGEEIEVESDVDLTQGQAIFISNALFLLFVIIGYLQIDRKRADKISRVLLTLKGFALLFLGAGLTMIMVGLTIAEDSNWIYLLMGITFSTVGGVILWSIRAKQSLYTELVTKGKGKRINYDTYEIKEDIQVNGYYEGTNEYVYANRIFIEYKSSNGKVYKYKSSPLWIDPTPYMPGGAILYVDPANPLRYFIDTAQLPPPPKRVIQKSFTF